MSTLVMERPPLNLTQASRVNYSISAFWDNEAKVWIATSDDISGLVLEDETYEGLLQETELAIPVLLERQNIYCEDFSLSVTVRPIEELFKELYG